MNNRPWKVIALVIVVAVVVVSAKYLGIQEGVRRMLQYIHGLGPWAPLAYVVFYAVASVFAIPGSLLTLSGGFLFGLSAGILCVSVGGTLGATLAFVVGRYLLRGWIVEKVGNNPKFQALDEAVAREGWKIVLLARLCPIFPFPVTNYGLSITRVPLKQYVLASWVGMLPATVVLVYIGSLASSLASLGTGGRTRTPLEWTLYAVGLLMAIVIVIYITRLAKRALQEKTRLP
jgi:uncharacterized membrane protein YdjX (TVP38/TMEM64 family)